MAPGLDLRLEALGSGTIRPLAVIRTAPAHLVSLETATRLSENHLSSKSAMEKLYSTCIMKVLETMREKLEVSEFLV